MRKQKEKRSSLEFRFVLREEFLSILKIVSLVGGLLRCVYAAVVVIDDDGWHGVRVILIRCGLVQQRRTLAWLCGILSGWLRLASLERGHVKPTAALGRLFVLLWQVLVTVDQVLPDVCLGYLLAYIDAIVSQLLANNLNTVLKQNSFKIGNCLKIRLTTRPSAAFADSSASGDSSFPSSLDRLVISGMISSR
jgi:hypothetical protein